MRGQVQLTEEYIKSICEDSSPATAAALEQRKCLDQSFEIAPDAQLLYPVITRLAILEQLRQKFVSDVRNSFQKAQKQAEGPWCYAAPGAHKFCFVVDNSRSMGGKVGQHAMTALVLMMEALRRLECPFSVVKFGTAGIQHILKEIDTVLDDEVGERILSAFQFNESTYPISGLETAMLHGFGQSPDEAHARHCIIFITDGIAKDFKHAEYFSQILRRDTGFATPPAFAVLHVVDDARRETAARQNVESEIKRLVKVCNNSADGYERLYASVQLSNLETFVFGLSGIVVAEFERQVPAAASDAVLVPWTPKRRPLDEIDPVHIQQYKPKGFRLKELARCSLQGNSVPQADMLQAAAPGVSHFCPSAPSHPPTLLHLALSRWPISPNRELGTALLHWGSVRTPGTPQHHLSMSGLRCHVSVSSSPVTWELPAAYAEARKTWIKHDSRTRGWRNSPVSESRRVSCLCRISVTVVICHLPLVTLEERTGLGRGPRCLSLPLSNSRACHDACQTCEQR